MAVPCVLKMTTSFDLSSPELRSQIMRQMGREGGLIGGNVRACMLTPERRREIAQMGAKKRWANAGKEKMNFTLNT